MNTGAKRADGQYPHLPEVLRQTFLHPNYLESCLQLYRIYFAPLHPMIHHSSLIFGAQDRARLWLAVAAILIGSTYSSQREAYQLAISHIYPIMRRAFDRVYQESLPDAPLAIFQAACLFNHFAMHWGTRKQRDTALSEFSGLN